MKDRHIAEIQRFRQMFRQISQDEKTRQSVRQSIKQFDACHGRQESNHTVSDTDREANEEGTGMPRDGTGARTYIASL